MNLSRRIFLHKVSTLSLGTVPLASVFFGCSATGLTTYRAISDERMVRISVFDYPEFQLSDGAIQLEVEHAVSPIVVVRTSENSFVALSPICTHLGCTVRKDGTFFRCPCHGSTYTLNGNVVRGPAEQSLRTFKTEYDGKTLVIYM
jgi:Rieske Fe-S protein